MQKFLMIVILLGLFCINMPLQAADQNSKSTFNAHCVSIVGAVAASLWVSMGKSPNCAGWVMALSCCGACMPLPHYFDKKIKSKEKLTLGVLGWINLLGVYFSVQTMWNNAS